MNTIVNRVSKEFAITPNALAQDARLSLRARGTLVYLLSLPPGWKTDTERIAAACGHEGQHAVSTALKELETVGYLKRNKYQDDQGRWCWTWEVHNEPTLNSPGKTIPRKSTDGSSVPGSSRHGKPRDIESTDTKNLEKEQKQITKAASSPENPHLSQDPREQEIEKLLGEVKDLLHGESISSDSQWYSAIALQLAQGKSEHRIKQAVFKMRERGLSGSMKLASFMNDADVIERSLDDERLESLRSVTDDVPRKISSTVIQDESSSHLSGIPNF